MSDAVESRKQRAEERPSRPDAGVDAADYRAVYRAAPDGILLVGREGRVRDLNPKAEELFGYERDELVGEPVEALVPEGVRELHRRERREYVDDPEPRPMGIGMELRGRRKDGTEFPVEISLSPVRRDGETLVIAMVRDVTQRKRLRDFGAGAVRAAEEERRRIARELHDDVAQRVATLLLRLRLAQRAERTSEKDEILEQIRDELLECSEAIRRLARGLRPPALQDAGLDAAIRSHVRERLDGEDLAVELELAGVGERVDEDVQLVVYRVVQEALSNTLRHAEADRVRIRLGLRDERVVAEVEDDGRGFDFSEPIESLEGGLGLLGMKERANAVGGKLELRSEPGRGTLVRMWAPLEAADTSRTPEDDRG